MNGEPAAHWALRVLLVDERPGESRLLALALASAGADVAETVMQDVPRALGRGQFDVCVLPCPRVDVVADRTRAVAALPGCPPVAVLVQAAAVSQLVEALAAGAYAYLLDTMPPRQMVGALTHAAQRRTAVPRSVLSSAADELRRDADPGLAGVSSAFTPRERQTLTMLRAGCQTREIAERLGISQATVRTYVAALVHKLGVRDRAEIAAGAFR